MSHTQKLVTIELLCKALFQHTAKGPKGLDLLADYNVQFQELKVSLTNSCVASISASKLAVEPYRSWFQLTSHTW